MTRAIVPLESLGRSRTLVESLRPSPIATSGGNQEAANYEHGHMGLQVPQVILDRQFRVNPLELWRAGHIFTPVH